ncbi:MAG TPA: hypothetical protein VFW68_09830 [Rhodocyclaceae bacterium]|nr:hypothetical protein [Rhodocyclaceae bacterium]
MKTAASLIALLLALLTALTLIPLWLHSDKPAPTQGMPWQIEIQPDGKSKVFGLTLGSSTVAEARQKLGTEMQIAIIATPGETGSVEAFYDNLTAGFVAGKMILTVDLPADLVAQMREHAVKSEYMESSTRRITLSPADLQRAEQAPIRAISFIPGINLDEAMVTQRFGIPAEKIPAGETLQHLLYPAKGLDVVVDQKGKEVLQYVLPSQFEKLRAPLLEKARDAAKN